MIPYILAAVGGYLIAQSRKDQQYADGGMDDDYAKGGMTAKGGSVKSSKYAIIQDTEGQFEQGFYIVVDTDENTLVDLFEFKKEAEGYLKEIKEKGVENVDASKYNGQKDRYEDGGMTKGGVKKIKLYHHKTSGGAEYLCSDKVKGTKDEGSLNSTICVRIDGAKTDGGTLYLDRDKKKIMYKGKEMQMVQMLVLFYHKTDGGAEYLCSSKVKGTKDEGSLDSKYVVRIDGAKKHGGELMIKD
jgi:hypothetical protein